MPQALRLNHKHQIAKIVLLCCVALSILLLSNRVIQHAWTYNSIIVTTPATKLANTVLQAVVESYNRSHSLSKLSMYEISHFEDSIRVNNGDRADFAVISPGTAIPNEFEVIASLNEEKVVLISHKGNRFEYLKDISAAAIDIVNTNDYDAGVVRNLFDFFEIADKHNKISVITLDSFLESKIVPNRLVYAFFLNPFASTAIKIFKTKAQKLQEKFEVIEIDLAELAKYSHIFFPSTIKKGELRIHPLLPQEDVDTVSAFTYLVARTSAREEIVYRMLTCLNASRKLIRDKVSRDALLSIEEISEFKNIPFHSGYKKFINGENEGFFQ